MKKTIYVAMIAALSITSFVSTPAQADTKSLVIIDSYFDSRVAGNGVTCINLNNTPCTDIVKNIPKSTSDNINHGDAMVEVAKRQNPNISIIALRAGNPSPSYVSDVNAGTFIEALKWVSNNADKVGAVSMSRYFNGNTPCSPASVNTAPYGGVAKADATIRSMIAQLKTIGIKVFVATGNTKGTAISYPACITDTESVSVGALNKLGATVSSYAVDANTDYLASSSVYSYKSVLFGLIANTTSAGNVAVAAKYVSGSLDNKVVSVLP
jgi:hypothetical protein